MGLYDDLIPSLQTPQTRRNLFADITPVAGSSASLQTRPNGNFISSLSNKFRSNQAKSAENQKKFNEKYLYPQQKKPSFFHKKIARHIERGVNLFEEKVASKVDPRLRAGMPIFNVPKVISTLALGDPIERAKAENIRMTGTTEERRALAGQEQRNLMLTTALMMSVGPIERAFKIDPKTARGILKVKEGATKTEISKAYNRVAKEKFPRTIEDLAKKYNTNMARIINDARDVLIKEVKSKIISPQEILNLGKGKTKSGVNVEALKDEGPFRTIKINTKTMKPLGSEMVSTDNVAEIAYSTKELELAKKDTNAFVEITRQKLQDMGLGGQPKPQAGVGEVGKKDKVQLTYYRGGKTGNWITTDPEYAKEYGKVTEYNLTKEPNLLQVNSSEADDIAELLDNDPLDLYFNPTPELSKELKIRGYDGFENETSSGDNIFIIDKSILKQANIAQSTLGDTTEITQTLRQSKGLSADDIIKKYPDINLKRDVPVTDIHGKKAVIPEGEALTPYELKGNKVLLQDGETYIVSKNQFANIKGQSVSGEAKEFAPELKGTEETVKGASKWQGDELIDNGKTIANLVKNDDGTWSFQSDLSEGSETFKTRALAKSEAELSAVGTFSEAETKYSQYQLPGGKNYKEVLIKAPIVKKDIIANKNTSPALSDNLYFLTDNEGNKLGSYNAISKTDAIEQYQRQQGFKSSHWDEPNVIAHIRLNERTYKDKPVTFLEELQSDWAREGRDKGFVKDLTQANKAHDDYDKMLIDKYNYKEKTGLLIVVTPAERAKWKELLDDTRPDGVPSHPLVQGNKWQEPSIKRALQEAVANDSEYFAWINGEQTSARYNLATHVKQVDWFLPDTAKSGLRKTVYIEAKEGVNKKIEFEINKEGKIIQVEDGTPIDWKGKKLDEVLGKGLADKIMADETGTLSGEGLKFGGEWANNLYDKQVKNIVKDVTGGKVEKMDLGLPIDSSKTRFIKQGKDAGGTLTESDLKVGLEINKEGSGDYIITDVLGDGKFKAVPKDVYERAIERVKEKMRGNSDPNYNFTIENVPGVVDKTQTFDISTKTTTQQGIKLTPEVKARIKGEAPALKQASGKAPLPAKAVVKPEVKTEYKRGDIASVEKKIDKLVGYTPDPSIHHLDNRTIRESMLEEAKQSAPKDIVKQINELEKQLDKIYELKDKQDELLKQAKEKEIAPAKEWQLTREADKLNTGIDIALKYATKILDGMGTGGRFGNLPPKEGKPGAVKFPENKPFETTGGRQIGKTFEKEMGVPLTLNKRLRSALGRFMHTQNGNDMLTGEIQLKNTADLDTLSHEVGHYIDFSLGQAFSGKKAARGILSYNKPLRSELLKVTEKLSGPIIGSDSHVAYRRSSKELIAEYIRGMERSPETTAKLAPEFTKIFNRAYKEEETVKYAVDKLKEWNSAFQSLKDYVDELRKIPEIRTVLTKYEEKGNVLQTLYRENVGNKLWELIERGVERVGTTKAGSYFVESKGLSKQINIILNSRSQLIEGQKKRIEEEIVSPLTKLSKEDSEEVARLVQVFKKSDSNFSSLAENTQKELAVWGNEARKLGLLNDEVFWNNVGQYFPYFYSTKEFGTNTKKYGAINFKKLRADVSGYKHKLTDEEMGIRVLENKFGTWPSSKEKIAAIPTEEKVRLGKEIREEMGLIKTIAYPVKKRLDQMVQSVYTTKALNAIGNIPGITSPRFIEGWEKLPDSKQLGSLANKYVSQRLYDEIMEMSASKTGIAQALTKVNSVWKTLKVPMNPATVSRNIQSNIIISWMGDTPIYDPRVINKGIKAYISKGEVYQQLRDYGMYSGTYSKNELQQIAFAAKDGKMDKIIATALKIFNTPSKAYGAIEDLFKTTMAQNAIDKGATTEEAVDYANKWLFDYGKTSKAVDVARQGLLPFITWSAKMFPRLIETAVRKPEKFLILLTLIAAGSAYARHKLNVTKEEEEKKKPWWLQERGTWTMLLPEKDKLGQLQYLDLSYVAPWGSWTQSGKSGLPQAVEPSNPLTILYNAYIANYDPFFRQDIAPEYLSDKEQQKLKLQYVLRGFLPSLMGSSGQQLYKSFKQEGDYYGRVKSPTNAILRTILGIKIEPGSEVEFIKKMNRLNGQVRDIEIDISTTIKHRGLSYEAKQKKIKKLQVDLQNKRKEMTELAYPQQKEGLLNKIIPKKTSTQEPIEKTEGERRNLYSDLIPNK